MTNDYDSAQWCDTHTVPFRDCQCEPPLMFSSVPFLDIQERPTEWIMDGVIPANDAIIFLGDEGLGKGLWWCHILGLITTGANPIDVLIIVSEDDPERTIKPRLLAAGADVSRVHLMVSDRETLTGVPLIPGHQAMVAREIEKTGARLVVVDPWMSVLPSGLQIKDTQQARQSLDPVIKLARKTGATFMLVTHTNRSSSTSLRDKYGGTVALRQAGRVCLMALEDPNDDQVLYVGVEKSNIAAKSPAIRYRKSGEGAAWKLTPTDDQGNLTIAELFAIFTRDGDERATDRWTAVAMAASFAGGVITRSQIVEIYDGNEKSADKAISRWRHADPVRLSPVPDKRGHFMVEVPIRNAEPPTNPPSIHYIDMGGMGGKTPETHSKPPTPPAKDIKTMGGSWGVSA